MVESTTPLLRVTDARKAFGPTQALDSASIELANGEVLAMLGENGSGKSTLVKLLAGIHKIDSGTIELNGEEISLPNPRASLDARISTVFQEVLVAESRSILENVWLGNEGVLKSTITDAEKREQAHELIVKLLGSPRPLDAPLGFLSLSDRQSICIVRSLVRNPQILMLDEATSALDVQTRGRLFKLLGELAKQGTGIIFISHRMDEIEEVGDQITVLRAGKTVATVGRGKATADELVQHMTGSAHLTGKAANKRKTRIDGEPVLTTEGLHLLRHSNPIDFQIRPGELVGLGGLEGHGQDAFLKALWGLWPSPGKVLLDGEPVQSSTDAAARGIAYVPRERRAESLFASKSIVENFGIATLGRDSKNGLYSRARTRARFSSYIKDLGIVLGDTDDSVMSLSGGNQQKVIVSRWLASEPRVLLLNDPTRGVDIGAKRDMYDLLRKLVSDDLAVVMLSTEVDEHVELMDRVLVFREHQVSAELSAGQLTSERLVGAFFGEKVK